jgi:hypothetical protein
MDEFASGLQDVMDTYNFTEEEARQAIKDFGGKGSCFPLLPHRRNGSP